jgi:hypothetical protein
LYSGENRRLVCLVITSLQIGQYFTDRSGIREQRHLDRDGAARAAFSVASDDPGPTGLSGHWRPLSMEDLAQDLGRSAGEAVVRWSEGNDLDAGAIF